MEPATEGQIKFYKKKGWDVSPDLTKQVAHKVISAYVDASKSNYQNKSSEAGGFKKGNTTSFSSNQSRNASIEKQCCLKAAVEFTNHLEMEMRSPENVVNSADIFYKWVSS